MHSIKVESEATSLCFHPSKCILAAGNIDGNIKLYNYEDNSKIREIMTFGHHKKSSRALKITSDDAQLVNASSDKSFSVINMETGSLEFRKKKAHESPIYSLLIAGRHIIATGDDDGCLKLWDMRHRKVIMEMNDCSDGITDMVVNSNKSLILATSGDGTLSAYDIRKHKLKVQSELMDSGLMSIAIVKNGEKVVCGSEDGVLNFFNWGEWGNISDRYPGHPMSVEHIMPLPNGVICTGASDSIRAVNLFPHKILEVIGDHGGSPIEGLSLSHCGTWLASCSHDQHIRFWDVSEIENEMVGKSKKCNESKGKFVSKADASKREQFFSDLVEDIKSSENDSEETKEQEETKEKEETKEQEETKNQEEANNGSDCSDDDDDSD